MKFQKGTRRKALEYEKDLVKVWKDNRTFERSVEMRSKDNAYVFYDGPPFITGVPHHGTLLSSITKDVVPRYQTMQGKRVERQWGWDCHGLPAEVFTEKKLNIHDKRDIGTKISLEEYILTCRENMVQTGSLWEDTIDRIGRWVDFKGAYRTMDKDYMESVWWAFKTLYEAGKIYEGEKVLLYCTRDATPISKAEVAMDNSYQDVTDPSVFVKFKLQDEDAYLLAWTTTPWTLPANTAVAVNKEFEYAEVLVDGQKLIIAKDLLDKVLTNEKHQVLPYEVTRTFKGEELVGKRYEPLFTDRGEKAHKVWHADYVSLEDGTGLVHIAPSYGEEDYALAKEQGIPLVNVVDDNGFYTEGEWKGQNVWEANKPIAKELHARGVVWKITYITHSYPHCFRCHTKLMYRAHPSWFMDIASQRSEMLEENKNVNWFPQHIKNGRFAKTVESAPDWNLSRDRFWATAMPVWKGVDSEGKEHIKVVGSYAELKELSGEELEDYHRPWVDDITFTIDGVEYKRIDKVLDCWFESGSMPFAQFHYPFENVEKFESNFPGDFIVEYVGQVRAWFYYVHAVSVALFGKNAFKNVIVTGSVMGADGKKLSKSLGNYTDPNIVMDQYSADSLRFTLINSPVLSGEDMTLTDKEVADVARKLSMAWNMYDFFTLYADVDQWEWNGSLDDPLNSLSNPLDKWVVSRVHQLQAEVEKGMDVYDIPGAVKPILPFLDDASNWYVRRSRRRFWKSGDSQDKNDAYRTLHYMLVRFAHIVAPFTPFLADELFRKLTGGESVHLQDWPKAGGINQQVLTDMERTRKIIELGLAQRMQKGEASGQIKVRQPLSTLEYSGDKLSPDMERTIAEEVNVKEVRCGGQQGEAPQAVFLDKTLTPELLSEGMMREVIRNVQSARKAAGLEVDDRIHLALLTEDEELKASITEHEQVIVAETLADTLTVGSADMDFMHSCKVENKELVVGLTKA
ncbi:MAG TPA: isoleucine--tRNA ligase [Candidatus Saccharimonadales bacterium]|nr:isoleucine--tRNA ligase [Candidatus Saccharimonadales bacterium]